MFQARGTICPRCAEIQSDEPPSTAFGPAGADRFREPLTPHLRRRPRAVAPRARLTTGSNKGKWYGAPRHQRGASIIVSVTALYRKYRPQDFDEVVGQEAVVRTLQNAIAARPGAAGLPLRGPARHRQDVDGAHPRQGAQLRAGPDADPGQDLPRLRRDRERHLARRHRDGRRLAARHRRHPRDPRARRAAAGRGPLQGLHPRRGAPAHRRRLERAAEADRGAAAAPRLRLLHDRPGRRCSRPSARAARRSSSSGRACRTSSACCGASPTARGSRHPTRRSR